MTPPRLTLAPALPHPPGTVRHVPDLVGAVLSASAVAAGVLAVSRGGAWGWLPPRSPDPANADAVPPRGALVAARRRRPTDLDGVVPGGDLALGGDRAPGGRASAFGATGTGVVLGGAIGVTGATVLIDRPSERPVPGHASVLVAVPMAAVLLAATALVRVAGASGRETESRSQGAAEEGPALYRRLLAHPRNRFDHVRSAAGKGPARYDASDSRVVNPR